MDNLRGAGARGHLCFVAQRVPELTLRNTSVITIHSGAGPRSRGREATDVDALLRHHGDRPLLHGRAPDDARLGWHELHRSSAS